MKLFEERSVDPLSCITFHHEHNQRCIFRCKRS